MPNKTFSRLVRIITGKGGENGSDEPLLEAGVTRLEKFAHFWVLVVRSFFRNRCPVRASALSYTTLLAIIPMLAVAISVTSSMLKSEGEDRIYQFIDRVVASVIPPARVETSQPKPEPKEMSYEPDEDDTYVHAGTAQQQLSNASGQTNVLSSTNAPASVHGDARVVAVQQEAAKYIHDFIQNTRSGTLGVTGMILLIFAAIAMLSRIEETFNDIWGVTRGRNWFMRIIQYWAVITLGPLLFAAAITLSSGSFMQSTKVFLGDSFVGSLLTQMLPMFVLWFTFALLYQLVPNTRVRFSAALMGGIVAGSLLFLNNMVGFLYVSRVITNSKIYGSIGLLPVFMAGLYLSWFILLFGAQVAYAYQNRAAYLQEKLVENVNQRGREFVALRLMTCIGQRFQRGLPSPTLTEMSAELGIPSRLLQQVSQTLVAAHLIVEVTRGAYTPARPLENINAHHILTAMRATAGQELLTRDEPIRAEVLGEFARIQEAEKVAASQISMLALVNRADVTLRLAGPPIDSDKEPKMTPAFARAPEATEPNAARPENGPSSENGARPEGPKV